MRTINYSLRKRFLWLPFYDDKNADIFDHVARFHVDHFDMSESKVKNIKEISILRIKEDLYKRNKYGGPNKDFTTALHDLYYVLTEKHFDYFKFKPLFEKFNPDSKY